MSQRRLQGKPSRRVFKTSSRCLHLNNFLSPKTSSSCLGRQKLFTLKICWRRLQDILKTNKYLLGRKRMDPWFSNLLDPWLRDLLDPWLKNLLDPWLRNLLDPWLRKLFNPWLRNLLDPWLKNLLEPWLRNLLDLWLRNLLNFY